MKKDPRIESVFDSYFDGAQAPSPRVTDGAKNSINKKRSLPAPVQRALIAVASVISACASAAGLFYAPATIGGIIGSGDRNDNIFAPSQGGNSSGDSASVALSYYSIDTLTESPLDAYGAAPEGMEFVKTLTLAQNCSLNSYTAYCNGENTAFVKAEFTASINAARHETVIYAEYTDENTACEIFSEYYGGTSAYYAGYGYTYFDGEINGEYVRNMALTRSGVKYYVSVTSSDAYAYRVWLDMILK